MELLRITRKSNDARSFRHLVAGSLLMLAFCAASCFLWGDALGYIFLYFTILSALSLIDRARGIRVPFESEFVIEADRMRSGRTDRPDKQRVILRTRVKAVIFDRNPSYPTLVVRNGRLFGHYQLPQDIVSDLEQMTAVTDTLRQHWPEVIVRDRRGIRATCRRLLRGKAP